MLLLLKPCPGLIISALLCLLLLSGATAVAQTDTTQQEPVLKQRWIIETKDGSVLQGIYLGQNEVGIRLLTESAGEILIPHDQIKSTKMIDESRIRDGEYWYENPNSTRYLYGPSAFSLKQGEAYYQNTYLVINAFHYGLSDNVTIGGGFETISLFSGSPIFFITPKVTFPVSEKVRAGVGALYLNMAGENIDFSGLGVGYGIVSYGSTDNNATLGVGYGFVDGSFSQKPILTLSGMTRLSRRVGLVTENWLVPDDNYYGVISYGIRFMGEKITVDLAFINNRDIIEEIPIGVPYIDFVVKFGK
ncbi:hypothetical protein FVR03_15140 [Pontibacter qinzhouensis]|uniref:Uncharacterized protein n=1 Tax=Pontibacter qinzhouensis TaxID=2603253 RepID=A0A5C8JL31_9BACT|nr:hypothetical protein [Pontibacter qinzhouensis]TXK37573.1 hypothetical protein FVR03_15140 [Pontibacter qinzhouensis]